jgi:hypothetical protein
MMVVAMLGGLLNVAWLVMIARTLFKLGRSNG